MTLWVANAGKQSQNQLGAAYRRILYRDIEVFNIGQFELIIGIQR